MNAIERLLREQASPAVLRRHGLDGRMITVLITPRFVTSRHVVAMMYPEGSGRPTLVVKVPRRPGDTSGVRREADMLARVAAAGLPEPVGVPELVGLLDTGDYTALVQTVMQGVPLDPPRVQRDFDRALAAGLAFVSSLPVTRSAEENDGWFGRTVERNLHRFAEQVPLQGVNARLVDRTLSFLEPLRTTPLPAVIAHGDLSHPNLFVGSADQLQVIDWERATTEGLPGQDLVFYLSYIGESRRDAYSRPEQLRVYDQTFAAPHGWGRAVLRQHLQSRGVPPQLLGHVVVATWALSASTLLERLVPDVVGDASANGLRSPSADQLQAAAEQDRDVALWRHALDTAESLFDG